MTTALRRGIAMFYRDQARELFEESRALRAEASQACGRSAALLRARRERRSAEPGDRGAQVHPD